MIASITRKARLVPVALALLAPAVARGEPSEAGRLPLSWVNLPEDGTPQSPDLETLSGTTYRRGEDHAAKTMDELFVATADALDKAPDLAGDGHYLQKTQAGDRKPWFLKQLEMELGINLSGTAGLITGRGDAGVEVWWRRTKKNLEATGLPADTYSKEDEVPADLTINEYTTVAQMEAELEPVVKAVMATGRVQNEGRVREGLLKTARELQDLMTNVNAYNYSDWGVNKFGIDVTVGGSGTVSAGWTFGLNVRLRFEWTRANYGPLLAEPDDAQKPKREEFKRFAATLAKDMDAVSADLYEGSGFSLTQMKIGVGMDFAAKFAVVKGRFNIIGYMFLAKSRYHSDSIKYNKVRIVPPDTIGLIDDQPTQAHMAYADAQRLTYNRYRDPENGGDKVVYYMERERFRRGLRKATSMGAWFAKRAYAATGPDARQRNWEVGTITPKFALSLSGVAGIVTIGGRVALELKFTRN